MNTEIERRFLLNKDSLKSLNMDFKELKSYEIIQGYLNVNPAIRVRKKNDKYYFCLKSNTDNKENDILARAEYEIEISLDVFNSLLKKCDGIILEKSRYILPYKCGNDYYNIEIDVFHKDYDGLIIAEIEFPSIDSAKSFIPPDFLYKEITGIKRYSNADLSVDKNKIL